MIESERDTRRIRSFVRRSGRVGSGRKRALEEYNHLIIPFHSGRTNNPVSYFETENPLIVEIGFGNGEALLEFAFWHKNYNCIGIEVYKSGIGNLLAETENRGLRNIRVMEGDAVEIIEHYLKPESVSGFHIFFPDPWPKKKHHKRRLIKRNFLNLLTERLSPEGYVYIVTDWEGYAHEIRETVGEIPELEIMEAPPWQRPATRFEKKGIEKNHTIFEFPLQKRK